MDSLLSTRRIQYRTDLFVLSLAGEVDLRTAPDLEQAFGDDLPPVTVVDLTRVTFLAAAGLRVLVEATERARSKGCQIGLVADDRLALRVLRVSGIAASIPTFGSLSDALRELALPVNGNGNGNGATESIPERPRRRG